MTMIRAITGALLLFMMPALHVMASDSDDIPRVPADRLMTDDELVALLDPRGDPELERIVSLYQAQPTEGLRALTGYFREVFSSRYYFDWKDLETRFAYYAEHFPARKAGHQQNTEIHMGLYPANARWKLPYRNLKGNEVSAYEMRHLARQHKMLDMAFMHHYEQRNPEYVQYFTEQLLSLNKAFESGNYEDESGGNGVYESFRAGYRIMNWLQVHAFYLGSEDYGWQNQLETIRTLLHTAAVLYERNARFKYGNHQTRGVAALAMVSIMLREFQGTDAWFNRAVNILGQHLEKEVNPDGFQFERSVHYHIGDIYNFFKVLQLAQLSDMPVPESWLRKLKAMFEAGVVLARPDRQLPVLQDDTNEPWAESNPMGEFMLLGAFLFDEPEINYFADHSVPAGVYWFLREEQIASVAHLDRRQPRVLSTQLPQTGYYVMREGWDEGDYHMVISAGLSSHKPDHQHGDMLGLVARANGQEILPNYQVRYFLEDYAYFKNSYAKNVAMVDGIVQGQGWISNKGGSGFGKWKNLPQPRVITWIKRDDWDFFAGSHDGHDDIGVKTYRKIYFMKGLGWIVRDIFDSISGTHEYQQVWQGHYSDEGSGNHHRSTFADGSGLEVLQLGSQAGTASTSIKRGKGNLVYTMSGEAGEYTTLLYPFDSFENRIPDSFFSEHIMTTKGWTIRTGLGGQTNTGEVSTDAQMILEHANGAFLLSATSLESGGRQLKLAENNDFYLEHGLPGTVKVIFLGHRPVELRSGNGEYEWIQPGSSIELR